jgi:phospholipid/cholesterol/gamma-HCH transport system permease protein
MVGGADSAIDRDRVVTTLRTTGVVVRTDREGDHVRLMPAGPFDLAHATTAAQEIANAERELTGCRAVELDLSDVDRIDGTGAVLLARCLDRLAAAGRTIHVAAERNREVSKLIALYRERRSGGPAAPRRPLTPFARVGAAAAEAPDVLNSALDFIGHSAAALPKAARAPGSVDWRSLPRLVQAIGADGMLVTSAANLLVGLIIGFLGVSQLGRFGATAYVPELVVVAHFRELGPLVTAIVVAGRSGAGLASEIATMKVSEEIDALRAMGFSPFRWLVVPRCLALVLAVPLLTWIGDVLALVGGLGAATALTDMTPRAYVVTTANAITAEHFLAGLAKTPFLALAIGLIACGQGLAAYGGAVAVGARTTTAVVLSIFAVIVINSVFTFFYVLVGV